MGVISSVTLVLFLSVPDYVFGVYTEFGSRTVVWRLSDLGTSVGYRLNSLFDGFSRGRTVVLEYTSKLSFRCRRSLFLDEKSDLTGRG